jgi:hypothetical protein
MKIETRFRGRAAHSPSPMDGCHLRWPPIVRAGRLPNYCGLPCCVTDEKDLLSARTHRRWWALLESGIDNPLLMLAWNRSLTTPPWLATPRRARISSARDSQTAFPPHSDSYVHQEREREGECYFTACQTWGILLFLSRRPTRPAINCRGLVGQ